MKNQPELLNKLYSSIYAFVDRRVNKQEDVGDLVQNIFLKLQQSETKLRDQDLLVPWLYRVARNEIIDFYRKQGVTPPTLSDTFDFTENETLKEVSSWLVFFISAMSEQDQQILQLTEMEGKTQKAAATSIGISVDAAKARHQRAKIRLKKNFEKCCTYFFDSRGQIIDYKIKENEDCCD